MKTASNRDISVIDSVSVFR